jgi:hypothetical protein
MIVGFFAGVVVVGGAIIAATMSSTGTAVSASSPSTISKPEAKPEPIDVSIPYDAAARLAYEEWRAEYNKGDFNEIGYEDFKKKYEAMAIATVVSKKIARDLETMKNGPIIS